MAALPALSLVGHPGAFLADPHSELPVKLWTFETFRGLGLLGGQVDVLGYPNTGLINNPDPLGTLLVGLTGGLLGLPRAYNLLVLLQLYLAMLATWALARDLLRDELAALTAAVVFALTPLVLVYPLLCAVTDVLNLWPYPLAVMFALRALRRPGWRDGLLGGGFAGLGFVTCPYNFVIFSALGVPLLLASLLARRRGLVPAQDPSADPGSQRWYRALLALLIGLVVAGGWYALWMKILMASPSSQVSEELVAATRHSPPYRMLHPSDLKRYTAFLSDYLAVGKQEIIVRDVVSRFYRAFSPGFLAMGLCLVGFAGLKGRRAAAALWIGLALFFAVASTGPFLPWDARWSFDSALNPAWLLLHQLHPGGDLILEPLRYGFVVALCLAVGASIGVLVLSRWIGRWVGWLIPVLVVAEVAWLSPVPVPLPVAEPQLSAAYERLDEVLPPGPIIELPYFEVGSQRFDRVHLLHQLVHGRPIADEIVGFPPRYLVENQYLAQLVAAEKPFGELVIRVTRPRRVNQDRERLAADGFVGIVVDPAGFDGEERARRVLALLNLVAEPVVLEDRLVYRLDMVPREELH